MSEWFCGLDGQQAGPFSEEQVRHLIQGGRLRASDLVWRAGMAGWASAGSVPELLTLFSSAPYVPPPSPLPPSPPMSQAPSYRSAPPAGAGPQVLPYAAPPITGPAALGRDEGPFLLLCGQFRVKKKATWNGNVVASPRAIYLLKGASHVGYHHGGLVGGLLSAALSGKDDTRTCDFSELPHPVRMALDPKGKRSQGDVIVLPREAVSFVKIAPWTGSRVIAGGDRFDLMVSIFRGGRARDFLAGHGWTLNRELVPTAMAIHGSNFGLAPGQGKPGPGVVARVLYAIISIVIIIILIAIKVGARHGFRRW